MSTLDANADELRTVATHSAEPAPAAGPLTGDPAALGLPSFVVGSVALGLALVGMVPAASVGAALPVILAATSIGLFAAAIWAAALGVYLYFGTASQATGGNAVPLGNPIM